MAIFGSLTEFPFLEVISMLRSRSGVLHFRNLRPYESLELDLQAGQLQRLTVDGVAIFDAGMARSYLLEISDQRVGDFEFRKSHDLSAPQSPLNIVVTDALRSGACSDSLHIPEAHLPDPQTRFTPTAAAHSAQLEDELRSFWVKARPLLSRGSSAEQLARELQLELRVAQVALYKLRTSGAIRPARRIEETMPISPPAATAPSQSVHTSQSVHSPKPSLVSRLLGALSFARKGS